MTFPQLLTTRLFLSGAAGAALLAGAGTAALSSTSSVAGTGPAATGLAAATGSAPASPVDAGPVTNVHPGSSPSRTGAPLPIPTATPTPAPHPTPIFTPVADPTPAPLPTGHPHPVAVLPSIATFTVGPSDVYQEWNGGSNLCIDFATTYAEVDANLSAPLGVHSVIVYWSFPGNSGSGPLDLVSGNHWNTAVGGYGFPNFTFSGNQTISYYIVVTDNVGHTVTSATLTNTLHPVTDCGYVAKP